MPNRTEHSTSRRPRSDDPDLPEYLSASYPTERCPTTTVRISSLSLAGTPRLSGEDREHIRLLAEAQAELPPITVHRQTMRVIDGAHRVQAALLNGRTEIDAHLVDCDEEAAFVLAVNANVTHGLPLTLAERKAAATRIIVSHPQWSNRAVGACTGLSDKTVSVVRRATAELPQSNSRLGRDGRRRPLNTEAKRQQAAALLIGQPDAGLREIARATGLSPATVRDVRQRLSRQEDPVPARYRASSAPGHREVRKARARSSSIRRPDLGIDPNLLLERLRNDPSLRFSDAGRRTLRWLHQHAVQADSWDRSGLDVPEHAVSLVAELARRCALAWTRLADQMEQQSSNDSTEMPKNVRQLR